MSSQTIAENQTRIKVQRVGHRYYRNWNRNGFIIALNEPISRDQAIEFITQHNSGIIPSKCNFDVCHPRHWTWQPEEATI